MTFRSSDRGNPAIPVNAAIVGYRINPGMPVADALEVYATAEAQNEYAAAVRRHPSWNPKFEGDLRWTPDPEWTTEEIRFARTVLIRAHRVFGPAEAGVDDLYCENGDWCILEAGHPGDCDGDRDVWATSPAPAVANA